MGFYWKFTRSGKYSSKYISLIIDVVPSKIDVSKKVWNTTLEELENFLLLLHDVEVINNPSLGAMKPAFREVVQTLDYDSTLNYKEQRNALGLVCGKDVMGRHNGQPLDWGYCSDGQTPISLDISNLPIAGFINAVDGKLFKGSYEDKLSCYRKHQYFESKGLYWDLMPKHIVMNPIIKKMLSIDQNKTEEFILNQLKWIKK